MEYEGFDYKNVIIDSGMSNEELVALVQAGTNKDTNICKLWRQNIPLVLKIANKYTSYAELDDLMQECFLGILEALGNYNADENVLFMTYAIIWMKKRMSRFIKGDGTVRLPEHTIARVRKYQKLRRQYKRDLGRYPTDGEICNTMDISFDALEQLKKDIIISRINSLDVPVGEDSTTELYEFIPSLEAGADEKDSVLDKVQNEELAAVLWGMVDALPEGQACALTEYYKNNRTLKEIGEMRGCSLNWVNQLKEKGLRTLRNPKHSRVLKGFTDDWYYSKAVSGNGVGTFNRSWTSSTERAALNKLEKEETQRIEAFKEKRRAYYKEVYGDLYEANKEDIESFIDSDIELAKDGHSHLTL